MEKFYNGDLLEDSGPNGEALEASLMTATETNKARRFPGVIEIVRDCQFRRGAWEIICNWYIGSKTNEKETEQLLISGDIKNCGREQCNPNTYSNMRLTVKNGYMYIKM